MPTCLPQASIHASHQNYVHSMNRLDEAPAPDSLRHIPTPKGHYIMKVLPHARPDGDVALFTLTDAKGSAMSPPYQVIYNADGSMALDLMKRP